MKNSKKEPIKKSAVSNETKYHLTIDKKLVPVSEEVYREYMNPKWKEKKYENTKKRCRLPNGSICKKSCSSCTKDRMSIVISLDLILESGIDFEDHKANVESLAEKNILKDEVDEVIKTLSEEEQVICRLIMEGKSQREISRLLNIKQSTLNYRIKRLKKFFKKFEKNFVQQC